MATNVVKIESHNDYKGMHGSLVHNNDIIETTRTETVNPMAEISASEKETTADDYTENVVKGVSELEITPKEYIDDRIGALEKSMDDKFSAHEKLLSEKIDHLATKFDSSLETKFNTFKTEFSREEKESRRFLINTILVSVGIATAVIIGVLGFVIK